MKIGEKLKSLRSEKDFTLKQLSQLTGISISFISDIENGRRIPGLDNLKKLADGLGVSAHEFIIEADEKKIISMLEDHQNHEIQKAIYDLVETLHDRPEVIELLKTTKHTTKEDILKTIRIMKALRDK